MIFGEAHLRHLLGGSVQHYNRERYHQGIGGKVVMPNLLAENDNGGVRKDQNSHETGRNFEFYHREAA